ncbi:MAG: alpha-ketoacid dehydrogenase subunit beta [Candidatus Bathyarchaeia archaeon]|nr:alpha-ketoacid dehydrogenase subunit beta [Candidatus Bathyarchaeota archaeon]
MREITYVEALNEALREEMRRDERVIILGEDVQLGYSGRGGLFLVTAELMKEFGPERVRDTPISEDGFVGAAIGAAATGLKPVVEVMYADFLLCCMNQIVNVAAKLRYSTGGQLKVPLVIRAMIGQGRGVGSDHSQVPLAWFMNVPGLKVVAPATPYDAKGLLKSSIREECPIMFFESFLLYRTKGFVPTEEYTVPLGKADVKKEGTDVTIVAVSTMVPRALSAAEKLKELNINAEVVDPRTLVPLDKETIIKSVMKTNRLVVAESGVKTCGVGAEIASMVMEEAFDYLDAPIKRVAAPHIPAPAAPTLEQITIPNENDIIKAVRELFER